MSYKLPGKHASLWMESSKETDYHTLSEDIEADAVIIGGGIAGLNIAYRLQQAGKKVVVLESRRIASSATGYTTAHISSGQGLIYERLVTDFGIEKAKIYADANQNAIEEYSKIVKENKIDCDFKIVDQHIFIEEKKRLDEYRKEYKVAAKLGLPVTWTDEIPLPFKTYGGIRYKEQAQFHPRKFLLHIAKLINSDGSAVYENTKAIDIQENGDMVNVKTEKAKIRTKHAIVATHFPFLSQGFYYLKMEQYSSYVLGFYLKEDITEALFDSSDHYIRTQKTKDGLLVIAGGEDHKVGQEKDTTERYETLESWIRDNFPVKKIAYRWSNQDNYTPDEVPLIGPYGSGFKHVYVATGFKGWGMTHGMVSAKIITDYILKKNNPWMELYKPTRKTSLRTKYWGLLMSLNTLNATLSQYTEKLPEKNINSVKPGTGKVIKVKGEKTAEYKDEKGKVHSVSAVCGHLGCTVGWNKADKSWDCPCHGSRYMQDGKVMYGPSQKDLKKAK